MGSVKPSKKKAKADEKKASKPKSPKALNMANRNLVGKILARNADPKIAATPEGKLWLAVIEQAFADDNPKNSIHDGWWGTRMFETVCDMVGLRTQFVVDCLYDYRNRQVVINRSLNPMNAVKVDLVAKVPDSGSFYPKFFLRSLFNEA